MHTRADSRKWPLFEKSGTKNFWSFGPAAVKPARSKFKKVFCFFFPKKKRFLS
jgi:hypothetical protein